MTDFLKLNQDSMSAIGFWSEEYRQTILNDIMRKYKKEIIKEWVATDFVPNGDKVLVKWQKRIIPLSDEELKDR
jgi:hypothetical protein